MILARDLNGVVPRNLRLFLESGERAVIVIPGYPSSLVATNKRVLLSPRGREMAPTSYPYRALTGIGGSFKVVGRKYIALAGPGLSAHPSVMDLGRTPNATLVQVWRLGQARTAVAELNELIGAMNAAGTAQRETAPAEQATSPVTSASPPSHPSTSAGQLLPGWVARAGTRLMRRAHFVQLVLLPTVLVPVLGAVVASAFDAAPALVAGVVFVLAAPTAISASLIFRGRELALWRLNQWGRYAADRADDSTASPTIPALLARLGEAFTAASSESAEEHLSRLEVEISGIANPDDRAALNSVLAVIRARALVARGSTDWRAPIAAAYDALGRRPSPVEPGEGLRFRVRILAGYVLIAAIVVWIVGTASVAHGS